MDVPRTRTGTATRRAWMIGGTAAVVVLIIAGLTTRHAGAASVERSAIWIDTVRRGDMVREVRAPGVLAPERLHIIAAASPGRVDMIFARPGTAVVDSTTLAVLSNPDVQLEALSANEQVSNAEAALVALETSLESQRLAQVGVVASARSSSTSAVRTAAATTELGRRGFAASLDVSKATDQAAEMETRLKAEEARLRLIETSTHSQLQLQRDQIQRLKDVAKYQTDRLAAMRITSGSSGVVQEIPLSLGQWVTPGTLLAKVVDPTHLKAVLRVPATEADEITIGKRVVVDTHTGKIRGQVSRLDPGVSEGTVGIDITFDDTLPRGARVDMSIDGSVVIDRIVNAVYMNRPAGTSGNSSATVFVLSQDGKSAVPRVVQLGRLSATTIEVLKGLNPGDKVIVSDMSAFARAQEVTVH